MTGCELFGHHTAKATVRRPHALDDWLRAFGLSIDPVSVALALCGLLVAVLSSRLSVPSTERCFGRVNHRGYAGA